MKKRVVTSDELSLFAKEFVSSLVNHEEGATVVGLVGDLGAGKTTFTQEVLKSLGVTAEVLSPTFVLMREYPTTHKDYDIIYHLDLYRLADASEIFNLGLTEVLENPRALVFIEWADRLKAKLPETTTWLHFEHGEREDTRVIY